MASHKIWQEEDDSISIYTDDNHWVIGDFDEVDEAQAYIDRHLSDEDDE